MTPGAQLAPLYEIGVAFTVIGCLTVICAAAFGVAALAHRLGRSRAGHDNEDR